MLEDLQDVPPALPLLLQIYSKSKSWDNWRRNIRAVLPDLRVQSQEFIVQSAARQNYTRDPMLYEVHLHGGLDILTVHGCIDPKCKIEAAKRIVRSVGLIADRVWLTDNISERLANIGRSTNQKLEEIMGDVITISHLLPLIKAGIVRFRCPIIPICGSCLTEFDDQISRTAKDLVKVFKRDIKLERRADGGFIARTGKCFEPPIVWSSFESNLAQLPDAEEYAKYAIESEVRSAFWVAREASLSGGSILSNSRLGLAGLLQPCRVGTFLCPRGL